jgi:hypothetical protein
MNTSSFSKSGKRPEAISIAGKAPAGFKGRQYRKLAPLYSFFMQYKIDGNQKTYTEHYQKEILDILDPAQVYEELGENAILLCWEGPKKFCHRHLISAWFKKHLNKDVTEI